jgi:hypothetical protein
VDATERIGILKRRLGLAGTLLLLGNGNSAAPYVLITGPAFLLHLRYDSFPKIWGYEFDILAEHEQKLEASFLRKRKCEMKMRALKSMMTQRKEVENRKFALLVPAMD